MTTYLAFDYGTKRIGVAVGESLTRSARALTTLSAEDWRSIQKVMQDWQPAACIVGLPLDSAGFEQSITAKARAFADELKKRFNATVHLVDERNSSMAADSALREARASGAHARRVREGDRDRAAAALILRQWLAER